MELSYLNVLIDSGVPVINVTASTRERLTVLGSIIRNSTHPKNIPVYLWNSGWGCMEQVNCNSASEIDFSAIHSSCLCKYD